MSRKDLHIIAAAFLSGIVGAMVATGIRTVSAQSSRELKGDSVTLTDIQGKVRVGLGFSGGRQEYTYFYLVDRNGREQVRFTVSPQGPPKIELKDAAGQIVSNPLGRSPERAQGAMMKFTDMRGRLTGTYRAGSGGPKEDNLQRLRPPGVPSAGSERQWLNAHAAALMASIRVRFAQAEVGQFEAAERTACNANVYCQMAFRQQAIALLLR